MAHGWRPAHFSHEYTTPYCPLPTSRPICGIPNTTTSLKEVLSKASLAILGAWHLRTFILFSSVFSSLPQWWASSILMDVAKASWDFCSRNLNCAHICLASLLSLRLTSISWATFLFQAPSILGGACPGRVWIACFIFSHKSRASEELALTVTSIW